MHNTIENYEAFLDELTKMAEFFSDSLNEARQQLYWELIGPDFSLDEWCYACRQAMRTETFHKVPLPGVLIPHMFSYRKQKHADNTHRAKMLDYAATATTKGDGDPAINKANVVALIASVWPDDCLVSRERALRHQHDVALDYAAPSTEETAARKAELRAQYDALCARMPSQPRDGGSLNG